MRRPWMAALWPKSVGAIAGGGDPSGVPPAMSEPQDAACESCGQPCPRVAVTDRLDDAPFSEVVDGCLVVAELCQHGIGRPSKWLGTLDARRGTGELHAPAAAPEALAV